MTTPLITPAMVQLDVPGEENKTEVIGKMAALIAAAGRAEEAGLRAAMLAREEQFATGLQGGIAIPHCRSEAVNTASIGFLRLDDPVDFGAKDGPADLIIGIAAPEGTGQDHMKLLTALTRALIHKEFLDQLRAASTPEEVAALITGVVQPAEEKADPSAKAAPEAETKATEEAPAGDQPVLLAITSCPTGIAHTYMAAEALEQAAKDKGIQIYVEPQGSGGIDRFTPEQIAQADAIIIASDVGVSQRERFVGMPAVESGVKRGMEDAPNMIDEAVAAAKNPNAKKIQSSGDGEGAEAGGSAVSWPKRIQQALMTGVSYMIPFVAAGGLLIALGFLFGGYNVTDVAGDVVAGYSFWNLPDVAALSEASGTELLAPNGFLLYLGAVFFSLGDLGMSFLVAALSGYIAYGLAGRPGIAPGFVGGAVSVLVGAGFIGGLVTGIFAGLVAYWLAELRPPRWLAGLMPVVIIPLLTTTVVGGAMMTLLGRPLAALMEALTNGLNSMSGGASAVLLGAILGLMMGFDMGGPVNKAAYLFATTGLAAQTDASFQIMAAVMAAGMVPPLAMALSTAVRPKLYTQAERDNGATAWLLGASFISEGAIPFAAADPFRVIPSIMTGGAVAGALSMALGAGSRAPHGGIFVFFAISPFWAFVVAIIVGTLAGGFMVTALKEAGARNVSVAG